MAHIWRCFEVGGSASNSGSRRRTRIGFGMVVPILAVVMAGAAGGRHDLVTGLTGAPTSVPGQSYQICTQQAQYLTSPWTYHALPSGSQRYTVAQYQALAGYGTTLPPLPSYIAAENSTADAAVIFAPGSSANHGAYEFPETPLLYFFEGGAYGPIAFQTVSGDEFIGGSASGYPEPTFDDGGASDGISSSNDSYGFSGGSSTLASSAASGSTTITTTSPIDGYISWLSFGDGTTYQIANHSGTTITLSSGLTAAESAGMAVYGDRQPPVAFVSAAAARGATTVSVGASSIPMFQYSNIRVGADPVSVGAATGSQSGYSLTVAGGLDFAATAGTPIYEGNTAGGVSVEYLDISHDLHSTTATIDTGKGWTVIHNNIHDGYSTPGQGIAIDGGDHLTAEYNCFSKMGTYAVNIGGAGDVFDFNEVTQTNYEPDPGCGCSGVGKWWGTLNADIVDNAFIDNGPQGGGSVWLDNGNAGTLIQGNWFDKSYSNAIASETGYNLSINGNLFQDDSWGSGSGCGSNCSGALNFNSSGGFHVPGSRYDNQIAVANNQFVNNWMGIDIWQSGSRSCENSGESAGNNTDDAYCSGGYPNTSLAAGGGAYLFSHIADTIHGHFTNLAGPASAGSSTILSVDALGINDQVGFVDPAQTTTSSTTNVSTLTGSQTISAGSTANFPSSGQLRVGTSAAWTNAEGSYTGAILSYTGTTSTSFTGVALLRGTGTLSGPVLQVPPYKVVSQTCYANDCAVNITPALTSAVSAGSMISQAGTCQLFATSVATPMSPLAPDGTSYFDGCQWGTAHISVAGNSFVFDPSYIGSATTVSGQVGTTCTAAHANACGTNFMAYQGSGEPPFGGNMIDGNAMMSSSTFTSCPAWDSGCTSDPLNNINALSNPPFSAGHNNEAPSNDVWAGNSYSGPWTWSTYSFGDCGTLPSDPATGMTMPAGACNVDFPHWQSDWQQDAGSSYSPSGTPSSIPAPTASATATPTPTPAGTPTPTPTVTATPTPSSSSATGIISLPNLTPTLVVDNLGGNVVNGNAVGVSGEQANDGNQQWTVVNKGGYDVIELTQHPASCLSETMADSTVVLWACAGGPNQEWVPQNDGTLEAVEATANAGRPMVLTDPGSGGPGTHLAIAPSSGATGQKWALPGTPTPTPSSSSATGIISLAEPDTHPGR